METAKEIAFNGCEVSSRELEKQIKEYARLQIEKDRRNIIRRLPLGLVDFGVKVRDMDIQLD